MVKGKAPDRATQAKAARPGRWLSHVPATERPVLLLRGLAFVLVLVLDWFVRKNDIPSAGAKGANLGELMAAGLPVPPGFVLTTEAYDAFVSENGLQEQIIDLAANAARHASQCARAKRPVRGRPAVLGQPVDGPRHLVPDAAGH